MNLNQEIFKGKTISQLFEEIYKNQKDKKNQIITLIHDLKPLISNIGDATVIVPLIKEYLDASIKNDEHLIKLGALIQKIESNQGEMELSEAEKDQLLKEIQKIEKDNDPNKV